MSTLEKIYQPSEIEEKWYQHWQNKGYFHAEPDEREAYSIVIPPPNVTGVLHMGHMLNNTIQDILIRRARLQGKNACWVPGTDHASIATEAKVVNWLREEKGLRKADLSRDQFMDYAWQWKDNYGGIILQQLKKLGASCDWERTAFTMDETRSAGVLKAFVDLYNSGKIYRGLRMINWDPQAKTVLSNEEVIYQEENARLFKLRYYLDEDPAIAVVIATQRPETIMADTAIAVHPEDERYKHLIGKKVIIPLINKRINIISDNYVDREFGTGALKVTPAHDINDYELGKKHGLEVIDILNEDGSLNESAQILIGLDRFEARKRIVKMLEEQDFLEGIQDYRTNIGRSERTNSVVEPRLSLQWFVDMKQLAAPALDAVRAGEIKFYPANMANTYFHWLENIRDWCISRQLWWGQRIPAFYLGEHIFVATTVEKAAALASEHLGKLVDPAELKQDDDVLDTWFSSWMWPITVFDGFSDSRDFNYYYPTATLVTGWDIIFLWVARMIMAGYEWKDQKPFTDVYFTGMVRDKQRRKMSKSLGNSPDALHLIKQYGADGVRFGMLSSSPAGGDLLFDEKLCEQGRNFCNKIWNAYKLIDSWEVDSSLNQSKKNELAASFIRAAMARTQEKAESNFNQYRLSENLIMIYSLIWDDFCSYYLEIIKPAYQQPIDQKTIKDVKEIFRDLMIILHPFMPFVSEEIYHLCASEGQENQDCIIANYPQLSLIPVMEESFEVYKSMLTYLRDVRNKYKLKLREPLNICIEHGQDGSLEMPGITELIEAQGYVNIKNESEIKSDQIVSGLVRTHKINIELPFALQNNEEEQEKIQEKIKYFEGFAATIEKKLANEKFVSGAPAEVIERERKKLADSLANIESLKRML